MRSIRAFRETVPVAAYYNPVLQNDSVSDAAVFPDGTMRMGIKIISDFGCLINDNMGVQDRIFAETHIFSDVSKWSYRGVLTNGSGLVDKRKFMNSGFGQRRLIKHRQRPRKIQVWIY